MPVCSLKKSRLIEHIRPCGLIHEGSIPSCWLLDRISSVLSGNGLVKHSFRFHVGQPPLHSLLARLCVFCLGFTSNEPREALS